MYVEAILRKKGGKVVAVAPDDAVAKAARVLHENRIGAALVRDEADAVIGIISERDIVRGMARNKDTCVGMQVRALMTSPVISCSPQDSIDSIMQLMTDQRIRHLPVMEDDRLVGIISIGDVVKQRISEIEYESDALRRYIATG
jgi:CBS domain-containing protein